MPDSWAGGQVCKMESHKFNPPVSQWDQELGYPTCWANALITELAGLKHGRSVLAF